MNKKLRLIGFIGCGAVSVPCFLVLVFLLALGPYPPPEPAIAGQRAFGPDFQKGITYEAWWHGEYSSANSDLTLANVIKPTGANWIALIVKCQQQDISELVIHCDTNANTATDDDIRHAIGTAHKLGLKVMLKPHIDIADPSKVRWQIDFGNDTAKWQQWFDHFTTFITHYASLAQTLSADYFVVGTELAGTVGQANRWRDVIKAVRSVYHGPLTYAALSFRDEWSVSWWDALDAIGVDAYYSLTISTKPTLSQLKLGWTPYAAALELLSQRWNRPIIFTEIGYLSVEGANRFPGNWGLEGALSMQEQADCYQAVFETFQGKPWWRGVFWWSWSTDPNQGGISDRTYTAHGKPAEKVLTKYFMGPIATPAP